MYFNHKTHILSSFVMKEEAAREDNPFNLEAL